MRKPFVGGNWKMNTDRQSAVALARSVAEALADGGSGAGAGAEGGGGEGGVDVCICPPFPYLDCVGAALCEMGSGLLLGAQDVYTKASGAFTGEVSPPMLVDLGVRVVLTGHSERRHVIEESEDLVGHKTRAALAHGLHVILCVGETQEQREAGETDAVNERQIRAGLAGVDERALLGTGGDAGLSTPGGGGVTIAYEPVWAIGTGLTASPQDAQDAHATIRQLLADLYSSRAADLVRIQYGGSVKPDNASELFAQPDIDGGLIGGASLKAADFAAIVRAAIGRL